MTHGPPNDEKKRWRDFPPTCALPVKRNQKNPPEKSKMKKNPKLNPSKTTMGGALAALLVLTFTPFLASGGTGYGKLEGTWNVTVTVVNCTTGVPGPSFPRLNTFVASGEMQEFSAFVPPSQRGPGHGVWQHLTDGSYSYSIKFFRFNALGTFVGWVIEHRQVMVDVAGDSYTATGTGQVFDANGNLLFNTCATETATRFE
jgi:hypothetical protein